MTRHTKTKATTQSNSNPTEPAMTSQSNPSNTESAMTTSVQSNPGTTESTMNTTTANTITAPAPIDAAPAAPTPVPVLPTPTPVPPVPAPIDPSASLPPASANIPPEPPGFTPVKGGFARGLKPKKTEAAAMPGAVLELQRFIDYAGTLGKTVPSQAQAVAVFDAGSQWTVMRMATHAWGQYAANEEGIAWTNVRALMDRIRPAFALAVQGDATLAASYPKLAVVLGAKKAIAKKSVATKAANRKSAAAGNPPVAGVAAKKAQKVAQAVASALAAAHVAAPAAGAAQPAATAAGLKSEPAAATTGTNGVAHA